MHIYRERETRSTQMKKITLSDDEHLIAAPRERAQAEQTTLNEQFRHGQTDYARFRQRPQNYDRLIAELCDSLKVGRKLSRDEINLR
jgi:hypothetical protein